LEAAAMSIEPLEPSSLVYTQDDTFFTAVGEPIPLGTISRIVVGESDALHAEALRVACARAFAKAPVEVCRRAGELLPMLRERPADIALLGLAFDDGDGVDVLHAVARERLARRVVIVSGRKDEHSLQALRTARFDGFFDPLEEDLDALVAALRQIADGRGYVSPSLCRRMVRQRISGVLALRLTPAELQVFSVIGDGSDDAEAALSLGLTESTIATHRRNLMRKLDVPTSAKLVREAVRLGVVQIKPDGEIVRPGLKPPAP
jgi:DNA-binding NarL/FixJ family response regulator